MKPVTVIIPTLNRPKLIINLINTLNKNTKYLNQIIVVNTSPDKLVLKAKAKNINIISSNNLLSGKNKALKLVKSPWILFLDDDMLISSSLISEFINNYEKYKFDAASGLILQKNTVKNYLIKNTSYGLFTFFKVGSLNFKKVCSKVPYSCDFLPGGFLFVKTGCVKKILGFDTNYLFPFFNEDTDLTVRIKRAGFNLRVIPAIKAKHLKYNTGGTREKIKVNDWYFAFGFNNSYFYFKNFNLYYYFLYTIFNLRDLFNVVLKFNITIFLMYIKGILYGYKCAKS